MNLLGIRQWNHFHVCPIYKVTKTMSRCPVKIARTCESAVQAHRCTSSISKQKTLTKNSGLNVKKFQMTNRISVSGISQKIGQPHE